MRCTKVLSKLALGTLVLGAGCAAENREVREEPSPVAVQQPVQQQPQVKVHVDQQGWERYRQRQLAAQRERERQVQQARAQQEEAARRAAEAQARAEELKAQAARESSARSQAELDAQAAEQRAREAQAQLQQRQSELEAAERAQQQFAQELQEKDRQLSEREAALQKEQEARQEAEARAKQALSQVADVREEARGLVVTLNGSVLFAFDQSTLLPDAQRRLDVVADVLKQAPDEQFRVEGYTDAIGDPGYNQDLSKRRADAVKDYLVSRGVSASQLTSLGHGEERAVADNSTAEGRANNRRVEIVIPKEERGVGGSGGSVKAPAHEEQPGQLRDHDQQKDNGVDFDTGDGVDAE